MKKGSTPILQSKTKLVTCQLLLLVAIFLFWWLMTKPGLIPPFMFQDENQAAFFFGEPVQIGKVIWDWFAVNLEIYPNLAVTLTETVLAFIFGTAAGLLVGLWLALAPTAAAIADPYIKGLNSMPRVILAPIFGVWFGLGIGSKVALGITLVFSSCSSTSIKAFERLARMCWRVLACSAPIKLSCSDLFIFRAR